MSNCAIKTLEGEPALMHLPPHENLPPTANRHPHMQTHPRYCVAGSTSVIRKMTIPQRQSPFMDDLVKSNSPPLHEDWQKGLFDVCVQTGGSCVIFITLCTVLG
ncbi:hypothetical protein O181_113081 [Austropuccinia psidii MF-1]|uniref:Uncharacterized protein n=1 Tax=Austropuccinia psidii MF-1 TaxID=1389203 RepID=A0A9Q3PU38_9BASI|nr:hypothetical protein [Austropuccinia psidii MF-1]